MCVAFRSMVWTMLGFDMLKPLLNGRTQAGRKGLKLESIARRATIHFPCYVVMRSFTYEVNVEFQKQTFRTVNYH